VFGIDKNITAGGAFVLEIILTFLLVFVVLLVTGRAAAPGFAGLAIGLVLTVGGGLAAVVHPLFEPSVAAMRTGQTSRSPVSGSNAWA
jgi:glycerol uptake facilitator-like aquaporin